MWPWKRREDSKPSGEEYTTWSEMRAEMRPKLEQHLERWRARMPIWESTIMAQIERLAHDRMDAHFASSAGDTIEVNAGCNPSDTQQERDHKIVGFLHRFHQQLRDTETGQYDQEVSEAIGMYMYGYFVLHPVNDLDAPLPFEPIMNALMGLQNVALAICFEAYGCDPDRFVAAVDLARRSGLFGDRLIIESDPMQAILKREVTSSELFHRCYDRLIPRAGTGDEA